MIPEDELEWTFSTSSGPGGQHANKASTRAEVTWNAAESPSLGPRQRTRILDALASRLDASGSLRLSGQRYRSQLRNRQDVLDRLATLVAEALRPRKTRVPTRPTTASSERRLAGKRRRSELKAGRRKPPSD